MKVNTGALRKICNLSEDKLKKYLLASNTGMEDYGAFLWHSKRKADILAVAHMDVALESAAFNTVETPDDLFILSSALDDRLGIFTILHLLPQFNIKVDILFTTEEEMCMSSAQEFPDFCDKDYNWIVEFDRAGTDVVLYEYETNVDLTDDLKSVGFEIGIGSYSDIRELEQMGVGAFNIGIGYHFQHTDQCCASMLQLATQLTKLQQFYEEFKDVQYDHRAIPTEIPKYNRFLWEDCAGFEEENERLLRQYGLGNKIEDYHLRSYPCSTTH
jgi:hypothetical protein